MIFLTPDSGLRKHWQTALDCMDATVFPDFSTLQHSKHRSTTVWLDNTARGIPSWADPTWGSIIRDRALKIIFTSSAPSDDEAIAALDMGCVGYCQAFSDSGTLNNVFQVVQAGQVWVGPNLMQRLIKVANHAKNSTISPSTDWKTGLSQREIQVAILAANGASNQQIARECKISERTIKAHLSSIFQKMHVTDRLQMTLRVHGIS